MEKKKKIRIRRKNSGIKKLLFILILLFIIIQIFIRVIVPGSVTLSRYVYTAIRTFYLNSKEFYFNSNKLSTNIATFESDNWSGKSAYEVEINMNSKKNLEEYSTVDIDYDITYDYFVYHSDGNMYADSEGDSIADELIDFYLLSKDRVPYDLSNGFVSSTIFLSNSNEDTFYFSITPKPTAHLQDNDYVFVRITATSTKPYVSTLVGEFKIIIGTLGMSYAIEDEPYNPYLEVIVTNTLDYYTVKTPFAGYEIGDTLTIHEYVNELTDSQRECCTSMEVNFAFDPNQVVLDTTSSIYIDAEPQDLQYEQIPFTKSDGTTQNYTYVSNLNFKIEAEESKVIKFFKLNAGDDYTYPGGSQADPVVLVTPV